MESTGAHENGAGPWAVVVLGAVLLVGFLLNFWHEVERLDGRTLPILAVTLGVTLSLVVGYTGFRLRDDGYGPAANRRIAGWTLAGAAFTATTSGLTILIRIGEGRVVEEPTFDLLVSAAVGALAGVVAGRYAARAAHEAREAERARDAFEFINGMLRHELLNGVNVIGAYADELDRRTDSEDDTDRDIEAIRSAATHLADLVHSIRPAAEAFASGRSLEPVDLGPVLRERVEAARTARPGARIETDVADGVHVDANEALDNVFANLLNNAIEHNDTTDPRVTVELEADGRTATVRIGDDGPGIPDDRKETVFEPRTGSDHGFGLYLVRTLVVSYGGTIRVEDNDPRGSVFVVELPRRREPSRSPGDEERPMDDGTDRAGAVPTP
jgi:signal transduction histidine kinase